MTARQSQIVDFLRRFTGANGYSPSYQEIATHLGLNSLATVFKHVHKMQDMGLVRLSGDGHRRTIEIVERSQRNCSECVVLRRELKEALERLESAEQALAAVLK